MAFVSEGSSSSRYKVSSEASKCPLRCSFLSRKSLFCCKFCRFLVRFAVEGPLGITASNAYSAQESLSTERPKYRKDAALMPIVFPPKGAISHHSLSMVLSFVIRLYLMAPSVSLILLYQFLSACLFFIRMTCMGMVLAPRLVLPVLTLTTKAFKIATGLTPG